jgi:aryl-alcohol dehydrogenase-like predicted oxidoreductase
MQKRMLGATGVELSVVGFGAAAVGGGRDYGYVSRDADESVATILRALETGINWIDTAPKYADGYAEELVGRALSEWGEAVFVVTKCGYPYDEETARPMHNLKRSTILREIDESLRRLRVDRIDLYQIHWPMPDEDIEEAYSAIADLVTAGKVRFPAVSNFSVEQMARVAPTMPIASNQLPYSLFRRDIEADALPYCAANDIAVLAYSPMQSGLLSGAFTRERIESLPAGDWRRYDENFREPKLTRNLFVVARLTEIAARRGLALPELAIAWTLRRPEVTAAIVGARSPEQVEITARAGMVVLDPETISEVEEILNLS